ncbi:MAG: YbhB/YbcL family Raf kinase inhibitor-like protein [Halobacteriota archaeon]
MKLTSPAFADGEDIPSTYGYRNRNVNPPLDIHGVPDDAVSLALVVDDPDAVVPAGTVWVHWLVWNVDPDRSTVPEDWSPTDAQFGNNDFGSIGYGGPNPPDRPHTYVFALSALDTTLDVSPGSPREVLEDAMADHVIDRAELRGTYSPDR